MSRILLGGNPPIAVTLRRSARARRLSLRISRLDGRVTLTMPPRVAEREGLAFLRERESWLRGHLSEIDGESAIDATVAVPYQGQELPVRYHDKRRVAVADGVLWVPEGEGTGARVQAFLKTHARDALAEASDRYAAALGKPYGRLTLRDTRSRWGSCTLRGDLMYSWRLIMAPPEVLDYVAAHEVAHLAEMNHSDRFWDVVESLYGDYAAARDWLRTEGQALHRVRFTD